MLSAGHGEIDRLEDLKGPEPFIDPDNVLTTAVGGNIAMPTTILYDSQGREVWRVVGGVEWDDAEVARLLDEAA